MGKSSKFANGMLKLVFQNIALANIGDSVGLRGSTNAGNLYVALMSTESTEINYSNYARISVARGTGNWSVNESLQEVTNVNELLFNENQGVTNVTATYAGIYTDSIGGDLIYSLKMVSPITIGQGGIPKIEAGNLITGER